MTEGTYARWEGIGRSATVRRKIEARLETDTGAATREQSYLHPWTRKLSAYPTRTLVS